MPTVLSNRFFELLRLHLESGVPIDNMAFRESQKIRIKQCLETFRMFADRPWMDLRIYISNRYGRSQSEISNDIKIINFIAEMQNNGTRALDEMKVRSVANKAIADGARTGNTELSLKGAHMLTKVAKLDQQQDDNDNKNLLSSLPIVITSDPSVKYKNKKQISDEEMKKIRKRWGVKQDQWQELVEAQVIEDVDVPNELENNNASINPN